MGRAQSDRSERGAWTPFVGVALAALTAGSLLLFSFIAQRTSLEGFSTRGVTAVSPSLAAPRSITLPEPSDGAAAGPSSAATTTETALSTLSPTLDASDDLAPATAVEVADAGGAAAPPTTAAGDRDEVTERDDDASDRDDRGRDDGTFTASFADDAESGIFFRDGEGRAAAQEWEAPDDGDDGRSAQARAKGKAHKAKSHKGKERGKASGRKGGGHNCSARAQRAKHNRDASARTGSRRGCSPRANQRRHGSADRGARGRSHHSTNRDAPAEHGKPTHSSPPAPRPQPQRASHPNGKGSPPAHSNAGGQGAQGRGRGHGRN